MKRLSKLDAKEVSLVPSGANKRKFLVLKKSGKTSAVDKEMLERVQNPDPDLMKRVEKVLKEYKMCEGGGEMDARAQAAIKAVVRILAPFKDQIDDNALDAALQESGFFGKPENAGSPLEGEAGKEGNSMKKPEGVSDAHHAEAMKSSEMAYGEHLKKLGYEKYPVQQPAMKAADGKDKDGDDDEDSEGVEKSSPESKGNQMNKEEIKKESEILANVPESVRPSLEMIFKSNQELVQKNADLQKQIADERRARRHKEFVEKASKFSHFTGDRAELAQHMMDLQDVNPKLLDVFEKQLESAEKVSKESKVFEEIGSSHGAKKIGSWEDIEKAAEGYVAKSGEKVTKEEAVTRFLETAEGQKMYQSYKNERGGI